MISSIPNTNNLRTIIEFQVFLSITINFINNNNIVSSDYFYLIITPCLQKLYGFKNQIQIIFNR